MILFLLSSLIFSSSAQVGSASDALGGTGIGAYHPLESIFLNPAALARSQTAYFGGQYYADKLSPGDHLRQYSVLIADGLPESMFPGGIAYRYRNYEVGGQDVREHLLQASGAARLSETFSVGLTGYKLKTDLPTGADYNQYNGDIGVYWQALPYFSMGAVARAVLGSKDNVAFGISEIKPSAGIGATYSVMEMINLRADANYIYEDNPDKLWQHHLGMETTNLEWFNLRAGLRGDDYKKETSWSAGFGFNGPRLKLAYAYQKEIRQKLGESHTVDIWTDF